MPPSVFLSHSTRDNTFCERLAAELLDFEVSVWYDQWEIKVGDSLRRKIASGIEENDYLAVVLSEASVKSPWVIEELNAALARELEQQKVVVLPLLIDDCQIPVFLKDKKWADFRTEFNKGLADLLDALGAKKRKKLRKTQTLRTTRRHDELGFQLPEFEEWFVDRLEEGNPIRLRRHLWGWREAVKSMRGEVTSDTTAAKYFTFAEEDQPLLDKLAAAGNALVRYNQSGEIKTLVDIIYDAFLVVNSWGTGSSDSNIRPAAARCSVVDMAFALGGAMMDERAYSELERLINRSTINGSYWERRSWFRYALTMVARGSQGRAENWYLPVHRGVEFVKSREVLAKYYRGEDHITDCLCQFDLLQCIYWVLKSKEPDHLSESYPSCAMYSSKHVVPLVHDLIVGDGPAEILPDYSELDLANILRAFTETVRERGLFGYAGWADDGWEDTKVKKFLADNRS